MSNDPFSDPPSSSTRASYTAGVAVDHDPLSTSGNRQSLPILSPTKNSPAASSHNGPDFEPSPSARSNRNSEVHVRTASSDPTALDGYKHGRTPSSDPTAVDSSTHSSPSHADTKADFTTEQPKKKGWTFFKTKEEKDMDNMKFEETDTRKRIEGDQEKEWKAIRTEKSDFNKHLETVAKQYKKLQETLEEEYKSGYDAVKKERKTELAAMDSESKAALKNMKKK